MELKIPEWNANYILSPDKAVLKESIKTWGVVYPLIVNKTGLVIDGAKRLVICQDLGITPPVTVVDAGEIESIILHIQINRGRGSISNWPLHRLIKRLVLAGDIHPELLKVRLGMTGVEFETLKEGDLIKKRNIPDHKYSPAWVPIESSSDRQPIQIERPPTPDG